MPQQRWWPPKTWPHRWWGPQKIPLNLHYALPLLGPLGVRGASWELGERPLAQQRWWPPQNLAPQVVGTPKHTPHSPLHPTSAYSIGSGGSKLGVRGWTLGPTEVVATKKLGPTGGGHPKTYPWEPLATLGLQSDSGALLPLLPHPLTPSHSPCSPSPPEPPWAPMTFLGPQEAL